MKIRVFNISLSSDKSQTDQDNLNNFIQKVKVTKTTSKIIKANPHYWSILIYYENLLETKTNSSSKFSIEDLKVLNAEEKIIYEALRKWRTETCRNLGIQNFMLCHNSELISVAQNKPKVLEDFKKIKGFGEQKINNIGEDIIALLNSI